VAVQFYSKRTRLPFRSSDSRYAGHLVYEAVPQTKRWSGRRRSRHLTFLHGEDLSEDKTEWTPFSFPRIMFLPQLYANVPRHLLPPHPPPPFSGAPPPPAMSGEEPGLCGLTNNQWHIVLTLGILREWAIHPLPPILSILTRKGSRLLCVLRSTGCPFNCPHHLVAHRFRSLIALAAGAGSCQTDKDGCVSHLSIPYIARY
jgi:hypothetical protein